MRNPEARRSSAGQGISRTPPLRAPEIRRLKNGCAHDDFTEREPRHNSKLDTAESEAADNRETMEANMNRKRSVMIAVTASCVLVVAMAAVVHASPDKKDKSSGRLLYGKVLDPQDNPLPDSIVYVTNTRTRAVKTYIVGPDGTYRFPALSTAVDYEVYAQYKGLKSDVKSVSQFDDRSQVYLDLRIKTQ